MKKIVYGLLLSLALAGYAHAAADRETFEKIYYMKMEELAEAAFARLEQKYPDEDWDEWDFPKYVFTSDPVEAGYRVAVKEPQLLRQIPCYCFCDAMGHKSLLNCFLKGDGTEGFDDHAVGCNICYGQAMMAFLWHEEGFAMEKILRTFENRFEQLIEQRGEKPRVEH